MRPAPTERLAFRQLAPEPHRLLEQLRHHAEATVDPDLLALIELRVSTLNNHAFCGEHPRRLVGVSTWQDSPLFTEAERAALTLTDAITRLGENGVSDEVWERVTALWPDKELADLISAIIVVNAVNRLDAAIGGAGTTPPGSPPGNPHGDLHED